MHTMTHHARSGTMQSKTHSIYVDVTRFMLASLTVGVIAAALLSSVVVALSDDAPRTAIAAAEHA